MKFDPMLAFGHAGVTIAEAQASEGPDLADARARKRIETAVLALLSDVSRTDWRRRKKGS